jgi:hypothetical protein
MNDLKSGVVLVLLFLLSGCGPNSTVREYEVAREQEKILTSDVLRKEFQPVPFRWKVPQSWRSSANDQFSAFAWTAGPKDASARITVSVLDGMAGVEPQFVRWRDQLQLPKISPAEVMESVESVTLKGLTGQWIEIRGETETILGLIAPYEEKLWIFKYRSANSTADLERDAFRGFCESLAVE